MTPEEFLEAMKAIERTAKDDVEAFHIMADELMTSLLEMLGYEAWVEVFKSAKKWYA